MIAERIRSIAYWPLVRIACAIMKFRMFQWYAKQMRFESEQNNEQFEFEQNDEQQR